MCVYHKSETKTILWLFIFLQNLREFGKKMDGDQVPSLSRGHSQFLASSLLYLADFERLVA